MQEHGCNHLKEMLFPFCLLFKDGCNKSDLVYKLIESFFTHLNVKSHLGILSHC